jgi:hypothetical protein
MPVTREEALAALRDGDRRIQRLVAKLSDADLARRSVLGGGDWSVADLLGHLASWEQRALDGIECWRKGRTWQLLNGNRAVDDLNEANVRGWRRRGPAEPSARRRRSMTRSWPRSAGSPTATGARRWRCQAGTVSDCRRTSAGRSGVRRGRFATPTPTFPI